MTIHERPANQGSEEDPHKAAQAIIRRLWMEEVRDLRARHDQERRDEKQEPIQNREIAAVAEIPESTLSDLLRCKNYVVPDWERFSRIIGCFGATTKEWIPRWNDAKKAYDRIRRTGQSSVVLGQETPGEAIGSEPDSPPSLPDGGRPPRRRRPVLIAMSAAFIALLAVGIPVLVNVLSDESGPGFDSGTRPASGGGGTRCVEVKEQTNTVSVFTDPHGYDKWTEWPARTKFSADVDASNPNRYRVLLQNGKYGYVNKDGRYVRSSDGCP